MSMDTIQSTILIVDDNPANLELLASMLQRQGFTVRAALNGKMALMSVQTAVPDLILLDINMPDLNGYQVCFQLKSNPATQDVPVIFLSALDDTIDKVKAFSVGGVDYITKPFQLEEVLMRIKTHLTLYYQRRELDLQRQEIQELREKEHEYFDEMNRMKDEFVRTVSHDLKNPIGIIVGYADILRDMGTINDEESLDYVNRIQQSAERMNTLVIDLLDLARIEAGMALRHDRVMLAGFLQAVVQTFELPAQQKHLELTYHPPDAKLRISLDPNRMTQVINNLLSNAIKYTPEGGWVEVAARQVEKEVILSISDSGLGIPADDLPFLFNKFYRVRRDEHMKAEGTGLGLAIVKSIIVQHEGRIWVESELGKGTTFFIALPLRNQ